jgi:hypothetical protein
MIYPDSMLYTCSRCSDTFCVSHRFPESHDCTGLAVDKAQREMIRAGGGEIPWFDDESGKPANQDSESSFLPNSILLVLILLLAAVGITYLMFSFFGEVL